MSQLQVPANLHSLPTGQKILCLRVVLDATVKTSNWNLCRLGVSISRPDITVKHWAYGHSVAILLNPRGVTPVSHKYSLTVVRHATVVLAVPSIVHYPDNYKVKYII
jgi:hypothetical protein